MPGNNPASLTLIIPVYNGAAYLPETFQELLEYYKNVSAPRLIFVNDGSADATQDLLENFARQSELLVTVLSLPTNSGKGNAIKYAIEHGEINTSLVGFTDVEIPYTLDKVTEAAEILQTGNYDLVVADRTQVHTQQYVWVRKIMATLFRLGIPRTIRSIHDTQSGLKLFRTETARAIFSRVYTSRWVFDLEIFLAAHHGGARVFQMPVSIKPMCLKGRGGVAPFKHAWQIAKDMGLIYRYERQGKYNP